MHTISRAQQKVIKEQVREEWFSLHLLDDNKKTPQVRYRMRSLYKRFLEVQ